MNPIEKPKRIECPEFLAWVRTLPCTVCGTPVDVTAHHMISVGAGGPDYYAVPACPVCHRMLQDKQWKWLHARGMDFARLWFLIAQRLMKWHLKTLEAKSE